MSLLNSKLSSFSLIEILVVMLLSTIITGIIYFSYYNVTRYQIDLGNRLNKLNDLSTLYFLLKKDFDRSKKIEVKNANDLHCKIPDSNGEVVYSFNSTFVIRRQKAQTDTFRCKVESPIFLWQGKILSENQLSVDELRLELTETKPPVVLSVTKLYDAASLIETIKSDTL